MMLLNQSLTQLLLSSGARDLEFVNATEPFPQLVNNTLVVEIVQSIHNIYLFKNFILYITERLDIKTDTTIHFFEHFWNTFPVVPNIIIRNGNNEFLMDGFISTPSLCLVFATGSDDPVMELAARSLRGVRELKSIFVIFPVMESDEIHESFESFGIFWDIIHTTYDWIWKKQFLNTILITIRNNIFLSEPYPTPTIINKTEHWNITDFFVDYSKDFKGYVVTTPIIFDLPRIFYNSVTHSNRTQTMSISGVSAKLFTEFLESINATLNMKFEPQWNLLHLLSHVATKSIEIGIDSYSAMKPLGIGNSYPIGINDWCIMVPYVNRTPDHLYLQYTFQQSAWALICFSVVYITAVIWLSTTDRPKDLSSALLQTICSLLCIPPTALLRAPTIRMRFIFFALFLLGFVISNMYISKIASYLTTSLQNTQINTVYDVIKADLRIKVLDFEYDILVTLPRHYPKPFMDLVDIVDAEFLNLHRNNLNVSYGYSIQTDRWNFLNIQQQYLRKPIFRLSQICMGPYYQVFPMQRDSHLKMPLKYFIMYSGQYGLYEFWKKKAFQDALRMKYMRMLKVSEEPVPLSTNFFRPMLLVWWFGLVLSGIVFILEMKWTSLVRTVNELDSCVSI